VVRKRALRLNASGRRSAARLNLRRQPQPNQHQTVDRSPVAASNLAIHFTHAINPTLSIAARRFQVASASRPEHGLRPPSRPSLVSMHLIQLFRKLYSFDTLDTRLVIPSGAPPAKYYQDAESRPAPADTKPPLWRTKEFYFYYVAFIVVVPLMIKSPIELSSRRVSALFLTVG